MKKVIFSLSALMMIFASCEKESVTDDTSTELTNEVILNDDASVEDALETSDYEVDYFAGSSQSLDGVFEEIGLKSGTLHRWRFRYLVGQAPEVSVDTSENFYPVSISLNYGEGSELENGKTLKGKILITITAPLFTDGSQRIVEFEDFFVDSIGIVGGFTNTFSAGADSSKGIYTYDRSLILNFYDGTSVTRKENKVREWKAGFDTPFLHGDDEIHITGTTETTSANGTDYTRTITEPLVKLGSCRFIVSGIVEFAIDGEVKIALDYGGGECDQTATMNRNGQTQTIRIGKWHNRMKR